MYQQTIPVLTKYLLNLSALLDKGAKFADENGLKHEEMLNFRLAPDMKGSRELACYTMNNANGIQADIPSTSVLKHCKVPPSPAWSHGRHLSRRRRNNV